MTMSLQMTHVNMKRIIESEFYGKCRKINASRIRFQVNTNSSSSNEASSSSILKCSSVIKNIFRIHCTVEISNMW